MEERTKETLKTIQNNLNAAVNTCNMGINELKQSLMSYIFA